MSDVGISGIIAPKEDPHLDFIPLTLELSNPGICLDAEWGNVRSVSATKV